MNHTLREALMRHLTQLKALPIEELLEQRLARIAAFGVYDESPP
jgi:acetyl-CoA carboxylase alpha subunit